MAIAPDAHSFGERAQWSAHDVAAQNSWDRREHTTLGLAAAYLGLTLPGIRVVDDLRVHTYLAARPEVDAARIGCIGLSEGGKRTMFLAALDERIAVAVVSGYFTTLAASSPSPNGSTCTAGTCATGFRACCAWPTFPTCWRCARHGRC